MTLVPAGWRRVRSLWRRGTAHDVDAELQFHFEERIAELVASGRSEAEARAAALTEFGDVSSVRHDLIAIDRGIARRRSRTERAAWLWQDLRYVGRSLGQSPGFVVMVAATLALGIGANSATFSLIDRLFLSAPPGIAHADQIRRVVRYDPPVRQQGTGIRSADSRMVFDYPEFSAIAQLAGPSIALAGYSTGTVRLGHGSTATQAASGEVIGDYFGVLGVRAQLGRLFDRGELQVATPAPVMVISDATWRSRFDASSDVIGKQMAVDGHWYTIIGVAGRGFHGADNNAVDLWLPMNANSWGQRDRPWYEGTNTYWIQILARTPDAAATARLAAAATGAFRSGTRIPDSLARSELRGISATSVEEFNQNEAAIATRLAGAAVLILLIAVANVMALFMVRATRRRREIAVRLALGISRGRLATLLTLEALVVAAAAGAAALLVARWGGAALRATLLPDLHWVDQPINTHVAAFAALAALAAGLVAGVASALQAGRVEVADAMKAGAREGGGRRAPVRNVLLGVQIALCTVLIVGAGAFLRSLRSVQSEPIGYDADRIVFARIGADPDNPAGRSAATARLPEFLERVRRLPGVERASLASEQAMYGISFIDFRIAGQDTAGRYSAAGPSVSWVAPGYFETMGMRIVRGRSLETADASSPGSVVVVNEAMAKRFWSGTDPVGACMILESSSGGCTRVVGVVTNAHADRILEPVVAQQFYLPLATTPASNGPSTTPGVIAIRAQPGHTAAVAAAVQRMMSADLAGVAIPSVHRMTDSFRRELHPWETGAGLFTAAGILALLVAAVGLYSTLSYACGQRVHEIGVRMALGARPARVVALVLRQGMTIVALGAAAGIAIALLAGKVVASMLYHTSTGDPTVLGLAVGVLAVAAALAAVVPALRGVRVDPTTALRAE